MFAPGGIGFGAYGYGAIGFGTTGAEGASAGANVFGTWALGAGYFGYSPLQSSGVTYENVVYPHWTLGVGYVGFGSTGVDHPIIVTPPQEIEEKRHYGHLWTPLREAVSPTVSVQGATRAAFSRPETVCRPSVGVSTDPVRVTSTSRGGAELPTLGVMPPAASVRALSRFSLRKPQAAANSRFRQAMHSSRANWLPPIPEVVVLPVGVRRQAHYAYWTPETVQNLPEEVLYML